MSDDKKTEIKQKDEKTDKELSDLLDSECPFGVWVT